MKKLLLLLFVLLSFTFINPVYSSDISQDSLDKYIKKISIKFSRTYCNTFKFGISKNGALNFAIGETNKEFLNNKFNRFVDYDILKKNILISLEKTCQVSDLTFDELKNFALK